MQYSRVYIDAIGYELAPVVVSTAELEARLEPLYERLRARARAARSADRHRRTPLVGAGYRLADGAVAAARKALNAVEIKPNDIDVLIYAGVCREQFEPATACHVAAALGVSSGAFVYDVSNACLGVLNGIVDIANRIELGQCRAGLVVACETAREINDIMIDKMLDEPDMETFKSSLATLTGGSGAVAVLVTDGSFAAARRRRLLGGATQTAPQHFGLCRWGLESIDAVVRKVVHSEPAQRILSGGYGLKRAVIPFTSYRRRVGAQVRRRSGPADLGFVPRPARLGGRPGRQGHLPPGRRRPSRRDPPHARHRPLEGFLDVPLSRQHGHGVAAADGRPRRGAGILAAGRPRRLPRHRQRAELPDARSAVLSGRSATFEVDRSLYPFSGHLFDVGDGVESPLPRRRPRLRRSSCCTATRPGRSSTATWFSNCAIGFVASCPITSAADSPTSPTNRATSTRSLGAVADLAALLDHLHVAENVTLVLHDWGGMIGSAWAAQFPERVNRLVILNTAAFPMPAGAKLPRSLWWGRNTAIGALLIRGANAFCRGTANWAVTKPLPPDIRRMYLAPYDSWAHRIAVLRFVQTIPLSGARCRDSISCGRPPIGSRSWQSKPVLICWGMQDFVFDDHFLAEWQRRLPHAEVHRFADAGHYLLEDAGDEVTERIEEFLLRT